VVVGPEEVEVRVVLSEPDGELDVKVFDDEDDIVVAVTVFEAETLLELEALPSPGMESGPGTYFVRS
jgi:hypothetical protein